VNPLDIKIRARKASHAKQALPAVLGVDMAGIVEENGPGVTAFNRGDEVYGMVGGVGGLEGTPAEFIGVGTDLLALDGAMFRSPQSSHDKDGPHTHPR
jgi:NADPH:quinone reductase-like Zn-dependent oxidoreductase